MTRVNTPISEIILFDSKGYEKTLGFDHNLLKDLPDNFKKMVAGNIQIEDILNFKNKKYIIDVSGALEDISGKKMVYEYDEKNRIGDHMCYISDLSKMKKHYKNWTITKNLKTTFEEIAQSWDHRLKD